MAKHSYGLVHDRHNSSGDPRFSDVANKLGLLQLPPAIDLRQWCSPVRDQGQLGSCTGFAIVTGFREFIEIKQRGTLTVLSPLFEYYYERVFEHTVFQDAGAQIRDGMHVLRKMGATPETDWPYDITKYTDAPPAQALVDAKPYAISAFHRVSNRIELKQALSINHPVVIGIEVWDSFESDAVANTGIVPIPNFQTETNLGGHAVCVVGYNDAKQWFIVKNSWGQSWGDHGYFYLPYGYFNPGLGLVMDMWTGRA